MRSKNYGFNLKFESFTEFRIRFFEKERIRLRGIFKSGECTDIKIKCGDFNIHGTVTTLNGTTYTFNSGDVRQLGYVRLIFRMENGLIYPCGVERYELLEFLSQ